MTGRNIYLYRLDVTYPEISGSLLAIWDGLCEEMGWVAGDGGTRPFSWPAERRFLSHAGAQNRKRLLERLGASVTIVRSLPVEWE